MRYIRRNVNSVFETLVEEANADSFAQADAANTSAAAAAIAALCLVTTEHSQSESSIDPSASYCDVMADGRQPAVDDIVTDEERIQIELGLLPGLRDEQVAHLRRQFALRNHPDLFAPRFRHLATIRMTIANALCDAYRG